MMPVFLFLLMHGLSFIAAGHVLLTKKDPRSALGWTSLLLFLPIAGLVIYLIFGISRAHSHAEIIMHRIAAIAKQYPHSGNCGKVEPLTEEGQRIAALGWRVSALPLCGGNRVTPLHNGDEAYPAMLEAIRSAKNHVFLSTYIFNYGLAARKFINELVAAHERGVDTRVLVDGVGALYSWKKPWKILRDHGVKTTRFRPPRLIPPNFGINLRSHRKVLVCDAIGFTGGMNISDGNLMAIQRKGLSHIQDVQFRFEGPVVSQLRQAFLLNWCFCTNTFTPLPTITEELTGDSQCRVIVDGPGKDGDALYDLICGVINTAKKSVCIMTPYFLPPCELAGALRSAAQRGVNTQIILPGVNNLAYMHWATDRLLPTLLKAGVKIWRQAPPFAHSKLLAIDGFYSLVGSANMDSRSLKLNFELNMEIYDPEFHDRLVTFMNSTLQKGKEVTLENLMALPMPIKLRNAASWLFSPYF